MKKRTAAARRQVIAGRPLTRSEHDAQHAHGDELAWWRLQGIDPFELAIRLYEVSGDVAVAEIILSSARKL